jgi:CheY-like chemotaxis protein
MSYGDYECLLWTITLRMLEKLGCQTDVAANGREAIEALLRCSYDLVFMDWQIPEMGGLEATRIIREMEVSKNPGSAHVPIIALTAHALADEREQCLLAGMNDFLSKPFALGQLRTILERWLPSAPEEKASSPGQRGV